MKAFLGLALSAFFTLSAWAQDLDALKSKAEKGDLEAQWNLGQHYESEAEYEKAFIWYLKAAEQNHQEAQYMVGFMYEDGFGTAQNDQKALHWYRKAAEQNHAEAQFNLAEMYFHSQGTEENVQEALH